MELSVLRYSDNGDSTLGLLFIDGQFECHTLEDEHRAEKKHSETRIPPSTYEVTLRTIGGFHARYTKRFPDMHEGMLWVRNVPGFEYILIHCGNTDEHTAGCLLVGSTANNNQYEAGFIGKSTPAYKRMYPKVLEALKKGEAVSITYSDLDRRLLAHHG